MTTRERILHAALECFIQDGYERSTVARIRERSGVSNGALFHHFPNKEAIAGALYVDAMRSVQAGYWRVLEDRPATLSAAVRGIVAQQLGWVEANPDRARFLYSQGHLDWSTDAGGELQELNRDLAGAYRRWLAPFVERGEARELPMMLVIAIVTGPAHAVAQRWLAGQLRGALRDHLDDLVDAAVAGLAGTPVRGRRSRTRPVQGRVRVELLASDGSVIGAGEAVADLT